MSKKLTPIKSIRAKCLECQGYRPKEVRLCTAIQCPLHSYRMGTNPHRQGIAPNKGLLNPKTQVDSKETSENWPLNDRQ